jgi:hypothetical protein
MKSPKKILLSYTKYAENLYIYALKTHVVNRWYSSKHQKKEYVEKNIKQSLLPIIIFTKKIVIPPNKLMQVLIGHANTFEDMLALIEKYIGAFISPDYQGQQLIKQTGITIKLHVHSRLLTDIPSKQLMYEKWYSTSTRHALEGAVQYYRPKVVVELGVYLGCSTVSLLHASTTPIKYYGFDYFTHICTNPENITFSPLDRFFLEYPKLETAVANVMPFAKKHNINFILYDVLKSNEYLNKNGIIPDLLFIDSIKDEHNLNLIIHKYLMLNPDIVIVGDDMIYGQIKPALEEFGFLAFGKEAYIITTKPKLQADKYPKPLIQDFIYPSFRLSKQELMLVPKSMHGYI